MQEEHLDDLKAEIEKGSAKIALDLEQLSLHFTAARSALIKNQQLRMALIEMNTREPGDRDGRNV